MDEQRRQDYLRLFEQFLTCTSEQELKDVFNAHQGLIDQDFLQKLAKMAQDAKAQGNRAMAKKLIWLLTKLVKTLIVSAPPRVSVAEEEASQFVLEILRCIDKSQGAAEPVYALLRVNQERLNDNLLNSFPAVAANLLAQAAEEEQQDITELFFLFGNRIIQFSLGQRAINMELAIAAYEQVLQVNTREAMPVDWAHAQMRWANAYSHRIRGDRADNLEQAIAAYEQVLTVMTREAMPLKWARAQMGWANAYYSRIRGDHAENLEQAIAAYEQVLQVNTR